MQCAHQQLRRDSPEFRKAQKAIPGVHIRENLQNPVKSLLNESTRTLCDDAL